MTWPLCLQRFPGSIWLCGLAENHDGEHVAETTTETLRWSEKP